MIAGVVIGAGLGAGCLFLVLMLVLARRRERLDRAEVALALEKQRSRNAASADAGARFVHETHSPTHPRPEPPALGDATTCFGVSFGPQQAGAPAQARAGRSEESRI